METSANPTTLSWTDKVREGTRVTSSRSWICVAHEMCWMHFCVGFISFLDAPFLDITLILVIILTSESPWLKRLRDHTRVQMAWRSLGACHRSSIQVQLRLQHLHGGRVHSGCRITRSTWFETFPLVMVSVCFFVSSRKKWMHFSWHQDGRVLPMSYPHADVERGLPTQAAGIRTRGFLFRQSDLMLRGCKPLLWFRIVGIGIGSCGLDSRHAKRNSKSSNARSFWKCRNISLVVL